MMSGFYLASWFFREMEIGGRDNSCLHHLKSYLFRVKEKKFLIRIHIYDFYLILVYITLVFYHIQNVVCRIVDVGLENGKAGTKIRLFF